MRYVMLIAILAGCAPTCPQASVVNGSWEVFANVLTREGGDEPDFPVSSTPVNGFYTWTLGWGESSRGPVNFILDGQPAREASGDWSSEVCGTFTLSLHGLYESRAGDEHDYSALGTFVVFEDRIAGTWDWSETWTAAGGESGVFTARGQIEGARPDETEPTED
ncbi:MAG: hypothetical protein EA397_10630 [Deltaproteobacteria bacterium]|nr:MAG: hypothetical protein EA397_10630 [Deltaproteobacteria bacterium]